MSSLLFVDLTRANTRRLRVFPGHSDDPWNANDWMVAVTGEVGELANKLKRLRRNVVVRNKPLPSKQELAEEIADIVIYLDLLATYLGIDMGNAIHDKFNLVSAEIGVDIYL
jgi:NTP pyrophosphatase (non-canonical NTP hydrolase)